MSPPATAIAGDDGLLRCPWGDSPADYRTYHDTEWGVPIVGEAAWLERLTLEAFQSGLSWLTILRKREAFRVAFAGFDADAIAAYGEDDVRRLMSDAGIVRNRRKIDATVANAHATVRLREDGGLEALLAGHAPASRPAPRTLADVPATTPESTALAKELKRRGFAHVGPTTLYALMQAGGLVDDHLADCHRRGVAHRRPRSA